MPLNPPVTIATAPTGNELGAVSRSIATKRCFPVFLGKVAASVTITSPWFDSTQDGTVYVDVGGTCSAGSGTLTVQTTDDPSNTTLQAAPYATGMSTVLAHTGGVIRTRYWRVIYLNAATAQTTFAVYATCFNFMPPAADVTSSTSNLGAGTWVGSSLNSTAPADNASNTGLGSVFLSSNGGAGNYLQVVFPMYGGAFAGAADAARQGWSKPRTPTVFRSATATASGNTAVWTPGSGNKFRLLRFKIQVTSNATTAAGGVVVIGLQDGTNDIQLTHQVYIGAAGGTTIQNNFDSGWIDLGTFGYQSTAANAVLNVNLGTALTAGNVNVIVAGVEE